MKRISLTEFCGALLVCLGLTVMTGWIFHIPALLSIFPNYVNMVFNTALCFFTLGIFLIISNSISSSLGKKVFISLGIFILLVAGLSLSQDIFNYSLGIDQFIIKVWIPDSNPFPGRMARNTASAFCLAGITLILLPYSHKRFSAVIIQTLIFLIFILGLSALLGYLLNLEFLYKWYRYSRMAIHTAMGITLFSIGLAAFWVNHPNCQSFYKSKEDRKILLFCSTILFCAVYVAGFTGFATTAKDTQHWLEINLEKSLQNKISIFQNAINHSLKSMDALSHSVEQAITNNTVSSLISVIPTYPLVKIFFSGIYIYDANNTLLHKTGYLIQNPALEVPLNLPHSAQLIWKGKWWIQYSINISDNNHKTYNLVAQWPLTEGETLFNDPQSVGTNNELVMCASRGSVKAICFPSRLAPHPFELELIDNNRSPRAMYFALLGKQGITHNTDYRGHSVIAAFSPLGQLGLGIVNKIDSAELYQSIRTQFHHILSILFLTIIVGVTFIYWQIRPLLRRVVSSEAALSESEKRFHSAFDGAATGMALVAPDGKFIKVNPALSRMIGYTESELLNLDFQTITHSADLKTSLDHVRQLLENKISSFQLEKRYRHKKGHLIWSSVTTSLIRDNNGNPLYFIAQIQDIGAKKEIEEKLTYQAQHDALTGLVNRSQLEYDLNRAIAAAKRHQQMVAILFIDLDHFKEVNDKLGHDAGDLLLKHAAECFRRCTRATDIVARLGGDEFIIILTDVKHIEDVAIPAEKIIETIIKPIHIKTHELFVTTSIGISLYPHDGENAQTLLEHADTALYQAKKKGRNNYEFFTPEETTQARVKIDFEKTLQQALLQHEFQLYYQPILNISQHKLIGMETLLRWENSQYGKISPEKIFPIAEKTGLILPLSEWILKTACQQTKTWQKTNNILTNISINTAAQQFKANNFIDYIKQTLEETQLNSHQLTLEFPENLIMQDPEKSTVILQNLKGLGIQIAIDEFGTGYSSITHLQHFAVDRIKINKKLIQEITTSSDSLSIVTAIIAMAKKLGIKTVAVGVETKEQFELLSQNECDEVQGYYVSHPLTAEKAAKFLCS